MAVKKIEQRRVCCQLWEHRAAVWWLYVIVLLRLWVVVSLCPGGGLDFDTIGKIGIDRKICTSVNDL